MCQSLGECISNCHCLSVCDSVGVSVSICLTVSVCVPVFVCLCVYVSMGVCVFLRHILNSLVRVLTNHPIGYDKTRDKHPQVFQIKIYLNKSQQIKSD